MIECKNIIKNYCTGGLKAEVLMGLNFKIEKGEFVAIMGPSGSGKSTLMHILGMLDWPTSGQYYFKNKDVSSLSGDELADIRLNNIGFIFQTFNLLKRVTVLHNAMLPLLYTKKPREEREKIAKEALIRIGLTDESLWSHLSNQISGGQTQRVAIARALVNNPELILADEPTGNLDSKSGEIVLNTFEKLNKEEGKSIIVITHEKEVAEFTDRIILIKDGRIVEDKKNKEKRTVKQGLSL